MMRIPKNLPDEMIYSLAVDALRNGKKAAVAVIVEKKGSAPRDVGSKIVVYEDGTVYGTLGGGKFERMVIKESLSAISEGRPKLLKYSFTGTKVEGASDTGLICGGVVSVYVDVLRPVPRVLIFGAGRVGKAFADLMNYLEYRVVVADPDPRLPTEQNYPYAEARITGDLDETIKKLRDMATEDDIVLVTHGAVDVDYKVVKEMLGSKARYVGLLGSKRKSMVFVKRLLEEGVPPELVKSKLRAPIGVPVEAETPEEIAISAATEIILTLRGGDVRTMSIVNDYVRELTSKDVEELRAKA